MDWWRRHCRIYYAHSRAFDALGRLWQDIGAANQTVTYQYDAQGNMKQVDGARTDVADVTSHGHDALDRLIQTLNADGGIERYTSNTLGQVTNVVDPANQVTAYTWDALDNLGTINSADTAYIPCISMMGQATSQVRKRTRPA